MKATQTTNTKQEETWPQVVKVGNGEVTIYKRRTPAGNDNFMLAYKEDGKRKMPCFTERSDAFGEADKIARRLDGNVIAARHITHAEAVSFFSVTDRLKPYGIDLDVATATLVQCLKIKGIGDLSTLCDAARFYSAKHKTITAMRVSEVVTELIKVKEARGAAAGYTKDLRFRLNQFSEAFQCNIGSVETSDVQAWLDGMKRSTQSYMNHRRVVFLLFEFAVARGYCLDNPITKVESVKIRNGAVEIFTAEEIGKLIAKAPEDFLPCIVLGAFAGLRSAEIERLTWKDIDLKARHIIVGADAAKTRSRRLIPISDNLSKWLATCEQKPGKIWALGSVCFYRRMQTIAKDAGVDWKHNALRHSYISYRLAVIQNAAQVALEAGNSPNVVFRHYRELVKPDAAALWFAVKPEVPETPGNVVQGSFASDASGKSAVAAVAP